jgi:hypothetical protein
VLDDGTVAIYSLRGDEVSSFSMGPECRANKVADCAFFGNGLVCRTAETFDLWVVTDLAEPRPRKLPSAKLRKPPVCMAAIAPQLTQSGGVEVLLATMEGSILVVDEAQCEDQLLDSGPFTRMVLSPSGLRVACFTDAGALSVMSTDFTTPVFKADLQSKIPPDIAWVTEDAVALYWDKLLLVYDVTSGDFAKMPVDSVLALGQEPDGVRLVSAETCALLQQLPKAVVDLFSVGSEEPPAMLYDASEAFESGSAESDQLMRKVADAQLEAAIDACLQVAAEEFNLENQRRLLRAASYGALFAKGARADQFVDTARKIRILNAVRSPEVGMPLTFVQYERLGDETVVSRLVNRHHHLLALRVCESLRMDPGRVLVHWACTKVRLSDEDDDRKLGAAISRKLQSHRGIPYTEIASAAVEAGRPQLAAMLLEHEPRASEQVPLLISMRREDVALDKAIASGDVDLVYLVLFHLKRAHKDTEVFEMVKERPLARNLLISYCRQHDPEYLRALLFYFRLRSEAAALSVADAYRQADWRQRLAALEVARDFYAQDKNVFMAQAVTEQLLLQAAAAKHEETDESPAVLAEMSVTQLLEHYLARGNTRRAAQLRDTFKVPDVRWWHIQVRSFAQRRAWDELERLASARRPPIGWQHFAEACIEQKNTQQAVKYIQRIEDPELKMELLCNINMFREAVEVAATSRNAEALQMIRATCRDPQIEQMIDRLLAKLQ